MKEVFLHYLWKYKLLQAPLLTTKGEPIEVIHAGFPNTDAGPDFLNAKLRIGETLWAGNVEIHLLSSSWFDHKHDQDAAYNNVVLHVVLTNDKPAISAGGREIPCLECSNLIPETLLDNYKSLMSSRLWVPCARIINHCSRITINSCMDACLAERLEGKASALNEKLVATRNDWEDVLYQLLARYFGSRANTLPFEWLAASLPLKILSRHHDQPLQIEALIFGQAGFLNRDFADDYPDKLRQEYIFLQNKYGLEPLDASVWKFLRLRPAAFPTIRLAQFAALMRQAKSLFSFVTSNPSITALRDLLRVTAPEYWNDHYLFDKKSGSNNPKTLSNQSVDLLIINAVVPVLFVYGSHHQYDDLRTAAYTLLEQLPAEKNSVVEKWQSLGVEVCSASNSQALLTLKQSYCDQKKCLDCRIGNELLKSSASI